MEVVGCGRGTVKMPELHSHMPAHDWLNLNTFTTAIVHEHSDNGL